MTDTWGIPGPVFAGLYLGLLLVPAAIAAIQAGRLNTGTYFGEPLTRLEQVALLAGGPERVADTAIAGMLEREQVRLDSAGKLHRTSRHPADELGRVAIEFVRAKGSSPDSVRWGLRDSAGVTGLVDELTGRGLLVDQDKVRRAWALAAFGYGAVLALGFVRLVAGAATGHPVGLLIVELLLAVVGIIATATKAAHKPPLRPTAAGRAARDDALDKPILDSAAGTVAVGGLENHPDRDIRAAVNRATPAPQHRSRSRWGATAGGGAMGFYGGSSCGGGGGSSCGGGGSSCGGGGGGCGG